MPIFCAFFAVRSQGLNIFTRNQRSHCKSTFWTRSINIYLEPKTVEDKLVPSVNRRFTQASELRSK
ncbi:MAG: hypothetical protein IM549_02375 [Pseudanabaena sp. M53BS1SP1A06MG]|nr:hypothetical protein [Pseudanabaena sp. M53BS1SP1A06MG]